MPLLVGRAYPLHRLVTRRAILAEFEGPWRNSTFIIPL
jgi:hypothetical protein